MTEWQHALLVKVIIVLIVFPALVMAFSMLWKPVLLLVDLIGHHGARWANPILFPLAILGWVVAIYGAFATCKRMWPRRRVGIDVSREV
jgi:hypothetical protein